jgi:hypothetical protein
MEARSLFGQILDNGKLEGSKFLRKMRSFSQPGVVSPEFPQDFTKFSKMLWGRVEKYTMTSKQRIVTLEQGIRYLEQNAISGDFVECGVASGGSTMAAVYTLMELGNTDRDIYLYDTFAGMPPPTVKDVTHTGKPAQKRYDRKVKDGVSDFINIPIDVVRANMAKTGYPMEKIHFAEGKVEDTLPRSRHDRIALLRLDTDWYESTKAELEILFPRLAVGGVLIIDDYFRWMGQKDAVDEYIRDNGIRIFLCRVDTHSVMAIKQ